MIVPLAPETQARRATRREIKRDPACPASRTSLIMFCGGVSISLSLRRSLFFFDSHQSVVAVSGDRAAMLWTTASGTITIHRKDAS